jgi:type IV pilus assembly protein PilY1
MRMTIARRLAAASASIALVLGPASASAQQLDVNPPLPNVLLLIDNSGSMERMIDGTYPESTPQNTCNCDAVSGACDFTAHPAPNRWGVLLQALTGTFQNGYNCAAMPRTPGSTFANEYQINQVPPYDINYDPRLPYHRPISRDPKTDPTGCVYAPGALPGASTPSGAGPLGTGAGGNATDFPSNAIVQHTYGTSNNKACTFSQYQDGALDSELDILRFGLMTFDPDPDPGTGVTTNNAVANPAFQGAWSYFPGWNTGAAPPTSYAGNPAYWGNPVNCATQNLLAVGARNPAAPPWEGRMMPFPATTDIQTQRTQNSNLQEVLLASRPYGATPLAGMFVGAQYYLRTDPTGPQATDTYVQGGCRKQYIILLTDGAPNLDWRPTCQSQGGADAGGGVGGVCPFVLPEKTAQTLNSAAGGQPVTTFVIGFAVSSFADQGQTLNCASQVSGGQLAAACLDPKSLDPNSPAGPCCELQRIALNGGTGAAYFADTPGDLQNAISSILAQISKQITTRTTPAFSPVVTNVLLDPNAPQNAQSNESVFLASFTVLPGKPWSGNLQRQRFACKSQGQGSPFTTQTQLIDSALGDDFAANLNSPTATRTFVMMQPDPLGSGSVDATATIRPFVSSNVGDGLGKYGATTFNGDATTVIGKITPSALGLTDVSCQYNATNNTGPATLTAAQCRDMVLDYDFGQSFGDQPNFPFVSRAGAAFGDVFHAMPAIVGPPGSLLRDDSYVGFRAAYANRLQIAYVATNDGLLHAFWADETKLENNEIWALMPPSAMPSLLSSYPASDKFLLDGSPIVKDVVWDRPLSNQGLATNWHTTLVAGFGSSQRGYYAVDVTNPALAGMPAAPPEPSPKGPVFLWQLTAMPPTNAPLFAAHSATPAVTSVFVDPGDGGGAREIGVAILPGGQQSGPTTTGGSVAKCDRLLPKPTDAAPVNAFPARTSVRCWGTPLVGAPTVADPVVGRSLSVVRLDTGEILRVFMRAADAPSTDTLKLANPSRILDTPLDSPMTGTPVVYPSDVGTDATKVFVGDADGTLWRFDLSNPDPSQWVGELYLDLYNTDPKVDPRPTSWAEGQPMQVPLVTSLDPAGELVINAATGSQETFDTSGTHFVYSITEKVVPGSPPKLRASVNWLLDPFTVTQQAGERVSGPMTVFDGVLYFATYAAAQTGAAACTSGHGRIWGLDFTTALDSTTLSKGGLPRLTPPPPHIAYVQPDELDPSLAGVVIPGVTINATPACAGLGTGSSDSYVAGQQHSAPTDFTAGQYSVFAQLGTSGTNGSATRQYSLQVPTPVAPTVIDSWAAVLE